MDCQNDQIQVNLCPTYDICLDSLLYTVYASGLPFCVISILLSSIRVSLRAIYHRLSSFIYFRTELVFI